MLLIACGIKRVVAEYRYQTGGEGEEMMRKVGIEIKYIHDETVGYEKKDK